MFVRTLMGIALVLAPTLAATLHAATDPAPSSPLASSVGAAGHFVRIEIEPAEIAFHGPFESIQLLVTGRREDGTRVDLTRDAKMYAARDADAVDLDARGRVRPKKNAATELVVEVGGKTLVVPLAIQGIDGANEPDFRRDVEPVLARLGCSTGTCHGSAKGKNGFKLSLRGYDPEFDYLALTDDLAGRRFDPVEPARSLFLLKPTARVPHEGGQRLLADSPEYALLESWVEHGARYRNESVKVAKIELSPQDANLAGPGASQQMVVTATYHDGSRRDVTSLAFVESDDPETAKVDGEGLVTAVRRGEVAILARFEGCYAATRVPVGDEENATAFVWNDAPEYNFVDELVDAKLRRVRVNPSGLATDAEFLRRAYLDLTGLPPTLKQAITFLDDTRQSRAKREELIDRLIGGPEFVDHWTRKWADLLQVNSKFLGEDGAAAVHDWIRKAVASDLPWDRFVREFLGADGSTLTNPPAAYYKVLRDADTVMENTTQLALGIRFNCNKCHDHPFERWTRAQHWQLAAYFAQVTRENAPGSPLMPEKDDQPDHARVAYEELVGDADTGELKDPESGVVVAPALPFEHSGAVPASGGRRDVVVAWLTAQENPYFAMSFVNRVWSYLTGVGLIEPVDDIRATNPPTNPELLDRLTQEFIAHQFSTRWLVREICRSRVYQQSVATNESNAADERNYSHATARRLPAEVLFDAVHVATGATSRLPGQRPGVRAGEMVDGSQDAGDGFLGLFGRPQRESVCECERRTGMSLGQALSLANGETVAAAIRAPDNSIVALVAAERDPAKIVNELYLAFLSRSATADEIAQLAPTLDPRRLANAAALSPSDAAELVNRRRAYEASLNPPEWRVATLVSGRSDAGAEFTAREDGSVLVSGAARDKDTYTLAFTTDRVAITGLRIEALADDALPGKGPGRAPNGHVVRGEVRVVAIPGGAAGAARNVVLREATADFAQAQFPPGNAIDGDPATGFAIVPRTGESHSLVFETTDDTPVGPVAPAASGTTLVVTLDQPYGGAHVLGKLRVSVSTSQRPVRHSDLPESVAASLRIPAESRSAEQEDVLHAHYVARDPELTERIRLAAAQDIAWALVNSKAFLFNR